jgi:universal stress protein A
MNLRTILVPTDFSAASDVALVYAVSLARDAHAKLLLLHVLEPAVLYGNGPYHAALSEPDIARVERRLQALPVDACVHVERKVVAGSPVEQILAQAANEQVDMVVLGMHGRAGLSRLLMGSVAESVVRSARCPVLAVKPATLA